MDIALIKGRHPFPVEGYIFEEIKDLHNYDAMKEHIATFLEEKVGIDANAYGQGINQNDATDIRIFQGKQKLRVYISGLTQATAALTSVCLRNGVDLTLMIYDKSINKYHEMPV